MRLYEIALDNVGPFVDASLDLRQDDGKPSMVTIITGKNGTGKSIILDAVRAAFGRQFAPDVRDVRRRGSEHQAIELTLGWEGVEESVLESIAAADTNFRPIEALSELPNAAANGSRTTSWVVDYWHSSLATDRFDITAMELARTGGYLRGSLGGLHPNALTTQFIVQVDYLRDSRDPKEKRDGELLWVALRGLASECLLNGCLKHVARTELAPVFEQHGKELSLAQLNAGSLYLMQRMMGLLQKMYGRYQAGSESVESLLATPGLLLIDEAENHLHPQWQKRLLPLIARTFPNLQVVAATHSPFVVSSAPAEAKVFVCEESTDRCIVTDASRHYRDLPVDEVLASPAFAETEPFGDDLTEVLTRRRQAIRDGDEELRFELEAELRTRNPQYFSFLELEQRLQAAGLGLGHKGEPG